MHRSLPPRTRATFVWMAVGFALTVTFIAGTVSGWVFLFWVAK